MKTIFDINGFIDKALGFSGGAWLLTAAILFALLCFCFVLTVRNGRMKPRTFWIESLWLALAYAFLMLLGRTTWAPEGGKVQLKARPGSLIITDEGPGMKAETEWGHGLGLVITRELLEKMGARMDTHNRPGGGLEITIHL